MTEGLVVTIFWSDRSLTDLEPQLLDVDRSLAGDQVQETRSAEEERVSVRREEFYDVELQFFPPYEGCIAGRAAPWTTC